MPETPESTGPAAHAWIEQPSFRSSIALSAAKIVEQPAEIRLLVIDDNADMREYITRLLSPYYMIEALADGQAALQVLEQHPPALVISDVMMPGLDGFQLLQAIRAIPVHACCPSFCSRPAPVKKRRWRGCKREQMIISSSHSLRANCWRG